MRAGFEYPWTTIWTTSTKPMRVAVGSMALLPSSPLHDLGVMSNKAIFLTCSSLNWSGTCSVCFLKEIPLFLCPCTHASLSDISLQCYCTAPSIVQGVFCQGQHIVHHSPVTIASICDRSFCSCYIHLVFGQESALTKRWTNAPATR